MNTLADFKRAMTVGSKWATLHHFKDEGRNAKDLGVRVCTIKQSNSFALATDKNGKTVNSWCDFPKAKEITFIDSSTAKIDFGYGTLIYKKVD